MYEFCLMYSSGIITLQFVIADNVKLEGIMVEKISYDFEDEGKLPQFSGEGRTITVEFDKFIFICCYVPNSGEGTRIHGNGFVTL